MSSLLDLSGKIRPRDIKFVWQFKGIEHVIVNRGGRFNPNFGLRDAWSGRKLKIARIEKDFDCVSFSLPNRHRSSFMDSEETTISLNLSELDKLTWEDVRVTCFLYDDQNKSLYWVYHEELHGAIRSYREKEMRKALEKFRKNPKKPVIINGIIVKLELFLECVQKLFFEKLPEKISREVIFKQEGSGFDCREYLIKAEQFLSALPGAKIPKKPEGIAEWLSWERLIR